MTAPSATRVARRRLRVRGVVQGVGFRPFAFRLAGEHGLTGFVGNDADGVVLEAQGAPAALDAFAADLRACAPAAARVTAVDAVAIPARGDDAFVIAPSAAGAGRAAVPPDIATCDPCLDELFDPADRRHRHPFISCAHCGPRLTIVHGTPYDRARTTMAGFAVCDRCRAEYDDPADRRFHAQPISCPDCGPRLTMPVDAAAALLRDGAIVAIKGIGGFHLACDATSEEAVARLRARKRRERRPFAVMCTDPDALAMLDDEARALLRDPARPIVLARRRPEAAVAPGVAPGAPDLGLLLPYSPIHHLLLADAGRPLVMTSANVAGEPIVRDGDEARARLTGIADAICDHDRPIARRCEDSVVRRGAVLRRSRGIAPRAEPLPVAAPVGIVGVGGQLASTFCVARGADAHLSAHLGDLDHPAAREAFARDLDLWCAMLAVRPRAVAHDLHPDYASTAWALEDSGLEPVGIQHHHAHAAACMAEHGLRGDVLALVFDGTGYGPDGALWGGELLRCDLRSFERLGGLEPVPLPGGEAAVRAPWRTAAAYLERAGRPVADPRWTAARQSLAVNAPRSSGGGRLFDAVSALLGVCDEATYEGQPAIELEWLAEDVAAAPYPCRVDGGAVHGADLVAAAHDDLAAGRPREEIAAAFHEGFADAAARLVLDAGGAGLPIVLSGGCFANRRLAAGVRARLEAEGRSVREHARVPCGDGGLSYGQAAVAAARIAACA